MWAWCAGVAGRVARLDRGGRVFSRVWVKQKAWEEECRIRGRAGLWRAAGGSLFLLCAQAARHTPARCLREGGLFLDPEDDQLTEARPLEMNEVSALTHTSLLKQASGAAVDSALQLLHRTVRATLDFAQQHRKQLQEVIDLLEYCTAMLRHPEEHDRLWELLVAARVQADSLKQQLRDLNLLLTYACSTVENTAMAAFISGNEFSASAARQMTDSAKLELKTDERKTEVLEAQYIHAHTLYIEAAQRVVDEAKISDDGGDDVEKDDDGLKIDSIVSESKDDSWHEGAESENESQESKDKEGLEGIEFDDR
uniref:Direct IAP-binding protein with low pI n=1 Tax=Scylla olivacea TaxID=85551 RepID=A0A0P4VWY5_SCYOL